MNDDAEGNSGLDAYQVDFLVIGESFDGYYEAYRTLIDLLE